MISTEFFVHFCSFLFIFVPFFVSISYLISKKLKIIWKGGVKDGRLDQARPGTPEGKENCPLRKLRSFAGVFGLCCCPSGGGDIVGACTHGGGGGGGIDVQRCFI